MTTSNSEALEDADDLEPPPARDAESSAEVAEESDRDRDDATSSGVRSLDRPFIVLRVLRENRAPMRLTEIATATKLHLATTQRLVNLLIRHGYVERDGVEYRLGLVSLIDGFTYLLTNNLTQIAEPILLDLNASTKLTAMLSVRHDLTQVRVLRILSSPSPRYQATIGEQVPLTLGGARVLAAGLSSQDLDRLLEGVDKIPFASGRVLDRQEFVESLSAIRERGFALGQGQGEDGSVSVAVPVMSRDGEVIAALQVSGHIEDIPFDVDSLVKELQRASAAITRRIP
ncbi:MAG: IclR family transcriptional regulator [Acidobacteriota bacterium]|nr:IclR family transcriptional regulator [Acidobacteriota bacterium]